MTGATLTSVRRAEMPTPAANALKLRWYACPSYLIRLDTAVKRYTLPCHLASPLLRTPQGWASPTTASGSPCTYPDEGVPSSVKPEPISPPDEEQQQPSSLRPRGRTRSSRGRWRCCSSGLSPPPPSDHGVQIVQRFKEEPQSPSCNRGIQIRCHVKEESPSPSLSCLCHDKELTPPSQPRRQSGASGARSP